MGVRDFVETLDPSDAREPLVDDQVGLHRLVRALLVARALIELPCPMEDRLADDKTKRPEAPCPAVESKQADDDDTARADDRLRIRKVELAGRQPNGDERDRGRQKNGDAGTG